MKTLRIALSLLLAGPASLFAAFPTLYLKNVCDDQLHAPTNIVNAGDGSGRLFISDQPGKIYVFQYGMLLPTPFIDLGSELAQPFNTTYSERGLLGLCFHPDFANESAAGYRCFYVNYTAPNTHPTLNPVSVGSTNAVSVIAEYKVSLANPNVADPSTKRILLTYGQPQSNHNGGQLAFGPDGYLYISSGDGGGANDNPIGHTQGSGLASAGRVSGALGNAQDRRQLLGKILRIDPFGTNGQGGAYGIPATNPFVGQTQTFVDSALNGPMRGEIFAYGMRNPWRFSFDFDFGGDTRLICADVGQLDVEEIDFIVNGGNYGWRIKEGTVNFDLPTAYLPGPTGIGMPAVIPPVAQYAHPTSQSGHGTLPGTETMQRLGASITGGYVYRGSAISALQGKYIFGDYAANGISAGGGVILGLEETSPGVFGLSNGPLNVANPLPANARIYCFGTDDSGEIYLAAKTTSGVLALDGGKPAGTIYKIQPVTNTSLNIAASKDNTMYEGGNLSNGKGAHLFAGMTGDAAGNARRRALLRFDLSSVPPGVTINSAALTLTLTKQISQDLDFTLHKVTADWGEGNSNAGEPGGNGVAALTNDATWLRRFYSATNWTTAGGDYVATASATHNVGSTLTDPQPTWTSGQLLADVQSWITTPSTNYGWELRGDETSGYTAMRFGSREHPTSSSRPKLTLAYLSTPQPTRYESWFSTYFPTSPPGTYLDPDGDNDGDGMKNLIEYAYAFSPTTRTNTPGLATSVGNDQINTQFTVNFRRDPRATDLTYEMEVSQDLVNWSTEVISVAGGVTSSLGSSSIGESVIPGESPLVLVTVSTEIAGLDTQSFVRLKVTRTP